MSGSLSLTLQFKQLHMTNGYGIRAVLDKGRAKILEKGRSKNIPSK